MRVSVFVSERVRASLFAYVFNGFYHPKIILLQNMPCRLFIYLHLYFFAFVSVRYISDTHSLKLEIKLLQMIDFFFVFLL